MAKSWDLQRGDTSGFPDRHFYLEVINSSGEPALVVGCGTGRLLLDYLGQGLDVEGVDISPEMLAICRNKANQRSLKAVVHQQAMEDLSLDRRFSTIIVPSASFQLVPGLPQAR